jgi:hypothetical protein
MYICNGERVSVNSCDEMCGVTYPDRPLQRGFTVQKSEEIGALNAKLATCKRQGAYANAPRQARPELGGGASGSEDPFAAGRSVGAAIVGGLEKVDKQAPRREVRFADQEDAESGERLDARYASAGMKLSFGRYDVALACRDVSSNLRYRITGEGSGKIITILLNPKPLVLRMNSDGSLSGPASIAVLGRVAGSARTTPGGKHMVTVQDTPYCSSAEALSSCYGRSTSHIEYRDDPSSVQFNFGTRNCPVGRLTRRS